MALTHAPGLIQLSTRPMAGLEGLGHLCFAMKQTRRDLQSGQAMVETAITMPLLVFIILGCLQLSLMHQARLLTKYAAYKAVRVGAFNHGRVARMETAAAMVLIPVSSYSQGGKDYFMKSKTTTEYLTSAARMGLRQMLPSPAKGVTVVVCSPTKTDHSGTNYAGTGKGSAGKAAAAYVNTGTQQYIFDAPFSEGGGSGVSGWKEWEIRRLAIQVTLNYRMPIPFANMMLFHIFLNDANQTLRKVTRVGKSSGLIPMKHRDGEDLARKALALTGTYIIPIRATYAMRMQSDLYPQDMPSDNECIIPYAKD